MEEKRIHAIADLTERRIKILQSIAGEKRRTQIISTDDEVGENVAASYDDKITDNLSHYFIVFHYRGVLQCKM